MKKTVRKLTVFDSAVLEKIRKIPRGKITTYSLVAKTINHPGAARAVGNALNKNPDAPRVPCHRIVKSDGTIGGYAGGSKKKIELLKKEGVKVKNNKIVDFNLILFKF
jgi:methylated-DNA-[protein]-cysteine S-methyltransferase